MHSNWSEDAQTNTDRLLRAIESGCIDILAHPTSAVVGTPGVPDYLRQPAKVLWAEVFKKCAAWKVAVELNCFPSRLDLPLELLEKAIEAGCAISIGSDSHSRSHLINLRFGDAALRRLTHCTVLNRFSIGLCTFVYEEPREAKPVVRAEAESTTVSALSVFFPSNEVFVFYELREPIGKTSLPGWSTI
jgi:hypothetical protein